jgi:hypothetical protein
MNTFSPRPSALGSASATYWRITPPPPAPSPAPGRATGSGARAAPARRWTGAVALQLGQDSQVGRVQVHLMPFRCKRQQFYAARPDVASLQHQMPPAAAYSPCHECPKHHPLPRSSPAWRADIDPGRNRRMARRLHWPWCSAAGARARALPAGRAGAPGARSAWAGSPSWSRPTSTPSRWTSSRRSRATWRGGAAGLHDALERAGHGGARQPGAMANWAATSPATPARPTCSRWLQPLLPRPRRRAASTGGDLVFFQPHSAPGVYARAFLEGRLTEKDLAHYRQEITAPAAGARGLSSYPHPWLMPDFWQFPTGSMGIGPISSIYHARFMRYLTHRGLLGLRGPQGVGRVRRRRDGRARVDERADAGQRARAGQPGLGGQLQPAAAGRPGARQRPHHRRAGGAVRRRRLERDQAGLGAATGTACSRATRTGALVRAFAAHGRRPDADLCRQGRPLQPRHTSSARTTSWPRWPRA